MSRSRVLFVVVCTLVAMAAAGLSILFVLTSTGNSPEPSSPSSISPVTPSTPGQSETPPASPHASPPASTPPTPAAKTDAHVVIVYSGWNASSQSIEVSGFIGNVIESNGTCTVTATKGTQTLSVDSPAMADATTTSCGTVFVPGASLSKGDYAVTLSYTSANSEGESEPVAVKVTK